MSKVIPFQSERAVDLRRQLVPIDEIAPRLNESYALRGWLGAGGLSVAYGPSNCGKTFAVLDMAMRISSGHPWRGHKVKRGPVVYIAAEGGVGIQNRIAAIQKARPEIATGADFWLLPTALDLHELGDAAALCDALPVEGAALIVIDTMARSLGAGDENSAKDVSQFVANLDLIRARTGAHVLVVHHSGKNTDAGARGSSALRAAVDTEIAITEGQIRCAKQRDLAFPETVSFALESVALGVDQDGDPVTSAILVEADAPVKKAKPLAGRTEVAAQALAEAIRLHGEKKTGSDFPRNRKVVALEHWRQQCAQMGLVDDSSNEDTRRRAWNRAKGALIEADHARILDGFAWKICDDD